MIQVQIIHTCVMVVLNATTEIQLSDNMCARIGCKNKFNDSHQTVAKHTNCTSEFTDTDIYAITYELLIVSQLEYL